MSKLRLKRWFRSIENLSLIQLAGLASLYNGITYIFGLVVLFGVFRPLTDSSYAITEQLGFIIDHKDWYQSWIMVIYVSFGNALVVLVLGLHERLSKGRVSFLAVGTAFGLIWAALVIASGMIANVGLDAVQPLFEDQPQQASLVWLSVEAIHNGIGGGMEVVGGIWVVLISGAALKQKVFSPWLNYLGMAIANIAGSHA